MLIKRLAPPRGVEPLRPASEAGALSVRRRRQNLAVPEGIEPSIPAFVERCLVRWATGPHEAGAVGGERSHDLPLTKRVRYRAAPQRREVVDQEGFQPSTFRLQGGCSRRLSYRPMKMVREAGIEPAASGVSSRRSTELSYSRKMVPEVGLEPTTFASSGRRSAT